MSPYRAHVVKADRRAVIDRREFTASERLLLVASVMLVCVVAVLGRLGYLQLFRHSEYLAHAARQQQRTIEITPKRGSIYDRNRDPLAMSIPVDSVFAVPVEIGDPQLAAQLLSRVLGIPSDMLEAKLGSAQSFAWVARKVPPDKKEAVEALNLKGVYFQKENQRIYPKRDLAAHVLGFVDLDEKGLGGIEYELDNQIRGKSEKIVVMADARQRWFDGVEAQQDAAVNQPSRARKITAEEMARRSERATLSLARTRAMADLQKACAAAHRAMLDRLASLPGVAAASASTCLPLAGGCFGNTLRIEGRTYSNVAPPPIASFVAVAGGYFEAMGMRIVRGRGIDKGDVERNEPVVVVSESMAKRYFPNQDPIGQHVASNRAPARPGRQPTLTWLTIVGIVSNTPTRALEETDAIPQVFMPMSIAGGPGIPAIALIGPDTSVMGYVVRSATPPAALLPSVRGAIDGVDRDLAIAQVRTLEETLDRASAQMAFMMVLLAIAASVTLMLGVIGIYGVMSYVVSQRTGEIGIRMALGAEPRSVGVMIVRQGGTVALGGAAVGLGVALAGGRAIESLLYGIGPRDPGVIATTTLILMGVALFACWIPARRAARLSPLDALRTD